MVLFREGECLLGSRRGNALPFSLLLAAFLGAPE